MKKSATRPRPWSNRSVRIRVVPGSNHSQSLMAGNFAAFQSTNLKFSALKDLILFRILSKFQEVSSILEEILPCQIDLILLHKGANDWFIVDIIVYGGKLG